MCMYTYVCCEVIIWSKFGLFRGHYLVQGGVIIWSKVAFQHIFVVVSSDFSKHSVIILCAVFCAQLSGSFLKIAFFKKGAKLDFSIFSVLSFFENSLFYVAETL